MEKLSRKEREYRTRREEILKAAESVFAQKGFHNSTVAEIAKESEFAIGTIYQFFKNKEELYYIMMIEKFDLLYSTLSKEVGRNTKCFEKLNCLVGVVLAFIEQNVDFFKIFTWELNVLNSNMNHNLKDQLITKHFAYSKLIGDVIKEGLQEGVLKEGNADDLSTALLGMMNIFSFNWIYNQQQDSLRTKAPIIVDLFLNGATRTNQDADSRR
ncbi:MAG: helix-turn-helix transcriptional regulator [Deltaproteobacteria bacterium]|nr:helix-turn-helix transcriptional regulator [Deltaproteobacteria bacterium]